MQFASNLTQCLLNNSYSFICPTPYGSLLWAVVVVVVVVGKDDGQSYSLMQQIRLTSATSHSTSHNHDVVSVHFNHLYCTEHSHRLSRDLALLTSQCGWLIINMFYVLAKVCNHRKCYFWKLVIALKVAICLILAAPILTFLSIIINFPQQQFNFTIDVSERMHWQSFLFCQSYVFDYVICCKIQDQYILFIAILHQNSMGLNIADECNKYYGRKQLF